MCGQQVFLLCINSDQRTEQGSFVSQMRSLMYWLLKGDLLILLGGTVSVCRTTSGWWSSRVLTWEVTVKFKLWVWISHHSCEEWSIYDFPGKYPPCCITLKYVFISLIPSNLFLSKQICSYENARISCFFFSFSLPPEQKYCTFGHEVCNQF